MLVHQNHKIQKIKSSTCHFHYTNIKQNLKKVFKKYDVDTVSSRNNYIMTPLDNTKETIIENEKSGIYQFQCKDSDKYYIGQRRKLKLSRIKYYNGYQYKC